MQIGNNSAAALLAYVEKVETINSLMKGTRDTAKARREDIKAEGYSPKHIVTLHEKTEDEVNEDLTSLANAAAALGKTINVGTANLPDKPDNDELVESLEEWADDIVGCKQRLKEYADEMKGILKEAKKAGFSPAAIKTVVKFREKPKLAAKFDESSSVVKTYWDALKPAA